MKGCGFLCLNHMNSGTFYCYSKRMHYFILSFGEKYVSSAVNSNTQKRYWTYNKSERLDKIIALYNEVKHKI